MSSWSRQTFDDICEIPKRLEAEIRNLEDTCVYDNTSTNRSKLSKRREKFTRYLKIQENIVRQKARVKWFKECDANTSYFHNLIKDRTKRLTISKIMNEHDRWLEGNDNITEAEIRHFQQLFTQDSQIDHIKALIQLDRCITDEDNIFLGVIPSIKKIK